MNAKIAQLIVHSITQACKGEYQSFSCSGRHQKGYRHITTTTIPTITSLAGVSSDFNVYSGYNTKIGERDLALCFGTFAKGLQSFVSAHAHALAPDSIKWINLHIAPNGEVYVLVEDSALTWKLTVEHPLYTWATALVEVMAKGFEYDTVSDQVTNWTGNGFSIKAQDHRIAQVIEIYQQVKDSSYDEGYEVLWATSNAFLSNLIQQMIFASVDLPLGYDHMTINFKDGCIVGNVIVHHA